MDDDQDLRSKLNEALNTEYRAGNISNAVYHGTQEQYAKLQRNIEANDARDGGQPEPGNSQPPRLNQDGNSDEGFDIPVFNEGLGDSVVVDNAYLAFPQNGKDYNYDSDKQTSSGDTTGQPSLEGGGSGAIRRRASDKLSELLSSDKYSGRDDGGAGGSDSDRALAATGQNEQRLAGLPKANILNR